MEKASPEFIASWDKYMILGAVVCAGISIIIFLVYEFRLMMVKDYKEKYDFVNLNEIKNFWYAVFLLIVAAIFMANTIATAQVTAEGMLWFYVRIFVTICFSVVLYISLYSMIRIYLPHRVEMRLRKLRNTPRISPDGNAMKKLSEEEEDEHLEASQIAEEASEVHSADYDVWIDEKTGYKKIEKYFSYQHAEECPECGYFTMKITEEELEEAPTQTATGLLMKHYRCSYCHHRERREVVLAKLSDNV